MKRKEGEDSADAGDSSPAKRHREASPDRPLVGLTVRGVSALLTRVRASKQLMEELVEDMTMFEDQVVAFQDASGMV